MQHILTGQLDDFEYTKGASLSHDTAVNGQFIGSCLPHMCLPFNSASVPLNDAHGCDESLYSYTIAFHTMMPLFQVSICSCGDQIDPLGLHFALCNKLNARNLLHNALRDCTFGALREFVNSLDSHNIALLSSDKIAKSSTYIHHWYPLRDTAPVVLERQPFHSKLPPRSAPSKSPDLLAIFADAPLRPLFADFVFASPRLTDNTTHAQAAQVAFNKKRADYSKYHTYPDNTFFPLAAERSGYLHPTFDDFIDTFMAFAACSPVSSTARLRIMYAIAFSITRMSASLLRAASFNLFPLSLRSLCPPPPLIPPVRWAHGLSLHPPRHRLPGAKPYSNVRPRRRAGVNPPHHLPLTISHGTDDSVWRLGEAPGV